MENTQKTIEVFQKALAPVVEKLGQGGQFVYEVYRRQQIVDGVSEAVWFIAGLSILFSYMLFFMKKNRFGPYGSIKDANEAPLIIASLILVPFSVLAVVSNSTFYGHFINPDYYVIQEMLSVINRATSK